MDDECSCGDGCSECDECQKPYCECVCDQEEVEETEEKDW